MCKPFNDSPYILTKGRQGCAFRIKMGHLFQKPAVVKLDYGGLFLVSQTALWYNDFNKSLFAEFVIQI